MGREGWKVEGKIKRAGRETATPADKLTVYLIDKYIRIFGANNVRVTDIQ